MCSDRRRINTNSRTQRQARGFTLLELMLAVSILAAVTSVTYLAFNTVTSAWKRGTTLVDELHHGDFVMDQLVMALRSAYYRTQQNQPSNPEHGFWHEDTGGSETTSDTISWVKLGNALVGKNCPFAGTPHRVVFTIDEEEDGEPVVSVRAWRLLAQPDDFQPDAVEPLFVSKRVTGFDCRAAVQDEATSEDEIDWMDKWVDTNSLPAFLEVTLYMAPLDEGEPPIELKRIVNLPVKTQATW